ncbi:NAD-dependent epimerase/dehydratase [Natronococcus amylolyticus DSM 10524]|uniref:NAD-dependent epimerase/dehydratase n=1 Tax=Natronococcus amylolyticus DSM 10524 TaxID=1227497 RepID=L9X2Z3_9EURY|nr:NAD-dependent epimerase/dehydratase [Natronococcus amylolyticus DSM 10524]
MTESSTTSARGESTRFRSRTRLELEYTDAREADVAHTHADIAKANDLLGYEPTRDIREGVREFIDWYRTNREWYEPLVRRS